LYQITASKHTDDIAQQKDILLNGWVGSGLSQVVQKTIEEIDTSVTVQKL